MYRCRETSMLTWILITALSGCNFYDLQDRATETAHACKLNANSNMGTEVFYDPDVPDECRAMILLDFRAKDLSGDSEQTLVNGAWGLLNYDWRDISDPSMFSELQNVRDTLGEQPNGFTLYNWSAAQFRVTIYQDLKNSDAAYRRGLDQLKLDKRLTPFMGAIALTHEAHHARGSSHIKCSYEPMDGCDGDNLGAYSASIAMLAAAPSADEYVDKVIADTIEEYQTRIEVK